MRHVVGALHHCARLTISNVFLLDGGPGDRWLIDTGHWLERRLLVWELKRAGLTPKDLTGVLLTHRHSDHAGNARFLQEHGAKVYAHWRDAVVLARRVKAPKLGATTVNPLDWVFSQFERFGPAARVEVDQALEHGDQVAGLEVHWMPGHTDGSVFYRHDGTRSLVSGDMLLAAMPPLTLRQGLTLPYKAYTNDFARALDSLRTFHTRGVEYDNLLAGHGKPILGGARNAALDLLERA